MSDRRSPLYGAIAALFSGAMLALSRDLGPVGPLILIAPVPILLYALAAPRNRHVTIASFAAQLLGSCSLVIAYGNILPPVALTLLILLQSLLFTLVILLTRWTAREASAWIATLSFPFLATATEFLLALIAPHGSFGAVGYALVDILPLLQLASLGGMAALAFAAGLFAMTCTMLISRPGNWRMILLTGGIPLALALAFGAARLGQDYDGSVRIALGAIDSLTGRAFENDVRAREVAGAYAVLGRSLGGRHPEFTVFPEKVF